ncbi:MAG: prephenate dehydrogenase [Bacteroidia bacterium]|nr:prephenate dehydrogenase [Bacteroidia bacterium]
MTVGIVGLGLIGGSLGLDIRMNGFADKILGVEAHEAHAEEALKFGLVDEIVEIEEACITADLLVLAVPVRAMADLFPKALDLIRPETVVLDMGSTKKALAAAIASHPNRGRAVLAHPMAGTEFSGPRAAVHNLFQGKVAILCDLEQTDQDAREKAERLFKSLFMRLLYMNSADHDLHAAYVSHVSHISSFVLALTVLEKEKSEQNIFDLASGGFASTVRLAKSSPRMWADVYEQNADHLVDVLDSYLAKMTQFRNAIAEGNFDQTYQLMEEANDIGRILNRQHLARPAVPGV